MNKKRWDELSTAQKQGIVLMGVIQLVLLAVSLRDIRGRSPDQVNGSKRLWTAALFINFVGPIAYLLFGRKR